MADVFLSYASEDRAAAAAVAAAIQSRGRSVWWDRVIPPGRQYDEVIEEQVKAAHCVVVLWSKASAASRWVKNEAAEALEHDTLVPALIEPAVAIPFEFRRVQAADFTAWREGLAGPAVDAVMAAIASLAEGPAPPKPAPAPSAFPPSS
ncbi:MAG: toll/interleukin-1 receptor domain-containing protein, partial [Burkholderiales bacterium]|nr:toll/interleukin-1 receptor domain-containing protein [Burkholderiales bacterium]